MATKIDGYKTLLSRITVAQDIQFHKDITEQIEPLTGKIVGLALSFTEYKTNFISLDTEFNKKNKFIETQELAEKDDRRDATTLQIISTIDYHAKFPQDENEAKASRALKFISDSYKNAQKKDYVAETSYLRNLIADIRKHADYLELFGLTSLINRLEQENNDFEKLHISRTNAKEAKRERGTLTGLTAKTNESFDVFCNIINGLSLMSLGADTDATLAEIASVVNGRVKEMTGVYNRHAGVSAGKKKEGVIIEN